jgi:hypothetical protein
MRTNGAFFAGILGVVTVGATVAGAACGGSGSQGNGFAGGPDGGLDATTDAPNFNADSSHGAVMSITVTPATTTLTVTDPTMPPTAQLSAVAKYADGTSGPVDASWTVDRPDIAGVGAGTGLVTPSATTFGAVSVTASAGGMSAGASVTVKLVAKINPGNVSGSAQTALDGATAADPGVTTFAYPYDATVFPRGLLPPEQQWNGGAAGDDYSLHYTSSNIDLTVYVTADPPSRFTLPVATWNTLTASAPASDMTVVMHRLSGSTAYVSATQTWHVADANLRGNIYYWAINEGQIYSIDLTAGTRSPVFASGANTDLGTPSPLNAGAPESPPWESNGTATTNTRCVACHSVSKDGSTLASVFSRDSSTGPLGFVDIASGNIASIGDYTSNGTYDALTPDGTKSVLNDGTKAMTLMDSTTAMPIASALDGQTNLCDPAFSPDGSRFALAANCDPGFGWPVEFRTSDLVFYSYANAAPYFTAPQTVVTSTGIGDAIAFPSFSPDSQFIFFQRGSYSRAKYGDTTMGMYEHGIDDLYVAPAAANATPIALANANDPGGILPADSKHLNYAPTVNPISEGGYIWVVFTTPRDYGNEIVSPQGAPPSDATYANHKQLWVTAVDANVGTVDPSHPAFWLPGQDSTTANMFGYWALAPCKATMGDAGPQTCSAGFECCSGFCRDTGMGPVCVDNPGGCHQTGEACTMSSDCCSAGMGVTCVGGICQQTQPN